MARLYSQNLNDGPAKANKMFRHIPRAAERTLDVPDQLDDYYLNLLDWSSNTVLVVALGMTVYLWDTTTSSIEELMTVDKDGPINSVLWAPDGREIEQIDCATLVLAFTVMAFCLKLNNNNNNNNATLGFYFPLSVEDIEGSQHPYGCPTMERTYPGHMMTWRYDSCLIISIYMGLHLKWFLVKLPASYGLL